jgi:type I restriction enzyme S subunit
MHLSSFARPALASERYLETTTQQLSELGASLSVKRFPGDFFLSIAGTVGKPIITKIKCCIHDGFVWFPNLKIDPEYLYYIFSTGLPYQGLGKWGTQLNLNTETVGEIEIPLLSEKEIINLLNFLDEKTTKIDKLITNKQKLIECLKEERTAIINQAVTRGINPNVKLKPSGIDWLSDISEHWEVKNLKYVAKVQSSNVDKKTIEGEIAILLCNYNDVYKNEFIDGSINFMKATAIENEIEKFILKYGDVLITKDSETPDDIAKPAFVTKDFNNVICGYHLAQIRTNASKLLGAFLFRLFQSKQFNSHFEVSANGVTRFGLPLDSITDVKVCFPSLEEQKLIVQHIEAVTKRIDSTISKIAKEIDLLEEYRTALISEVVTGKIKVI